MSKFLKLINAIFITAALIAVMACGGSSGGGAPATGQVAVVITDGPTDLYERVLITLSRMTLIGSGGQEVIYDGDPITFDLLQLRDRADFAFSEQVAVGDYNKIRLEVTGVTLVDLDNPTPSGEVELTDLPANGKIDLNPQGPFEVVAGQATVIELDIDALRSFQVVETGNGGLRFRPVIFVNVYNDDIVMPGRMTRVFGTVDAVDTTASSLLLCNLRFVAQLGGTPAADTDECVQVFAETAQNFGADGLALADFAALADAIDAATDPVQLTAIGLASLPDDTAADAVVLNLDAVVTELGPRETDTDPGWETTRGMIVTDRTTENCAAAQCVDFLPAGSDTALTVQLQPETQVFASGGTEMSQEDLGSGVAGAFDWLPFNDELRASLMITRSTGGADLLSGILTDVMLDVESDADPGVTFDVLTVLLEDSSTQGVCVYDDTDVLRIIVDDETTSIVDILDPAVLDPSEGLLVDVGGEASDLANTHCEIDADVVIVE